MLARLLMLSLWCCFLLMANTAVAQEFTNASPTPRACVPDCRSGYMCHEGQCVSRCNPPCSGGQVCGASGECSGAVKPTQQNDSGTPAARVKNPQGGARYGIMGGVLFDGEVYVNSSVEGYADTESGTILRGHLDRLITPALSMGIYANFISTSGYFYRVRSNFEASIISIGGTIKFINKLSDDMELRIGVGLGYQMSEINNVPGGDDIKGFDAAPITELSIRVAPGLRSVFSVAGFSQPSGGNSELDATWAPIIFICAGIEVE